MTYLGWRCTCGQTIVAKEDVERGDVFCPSCGDRFALTGTQDSRWIARYPKFEEDQ